MKVLLIGNSDQYNAIENSYYNAFRNIGYNVLFVHNITKGRGSTISKIYNKFLSNQADFEKKIHLKFEEFKPDIVIIFKCWYLSEKILNNLRSGAHLVNFTTDHPLGNQLLKKRITSSKIRLFDAVITFSDSLIPIWYSLSAKYCISIPFGVDESLRKNPSDFHSLEYSYFGSWGPYVESSLLSMGVRELNIFGPGWSKASVESRKNFNINSPKFKGMNMESLINQSYCTINLVRPNHGCFHSMKTFEIPNSGGLSISNYTDEQNYFFKEGHSALYFRDLRSTQELMKLVKEDISYAQELRRKGHLESLNHTYDVRAKSILVKLNS